MPRVLIAETAMISYFNAERRDVQDVFAAMRYYVFKEYTYTYARFVERVVLQC